MREVKTKRYSGPERRDYCKEDCPFAEQAKKSLPRIYFFASWSALIVVGIAFAGWHESSMDKLEFELIQRSQLHKTEVADRMSIATTAYTQDVERFIRATKEIRDLLQTVQIDIGLIKVANAEIRTTQSLLKERIETKEKEGKPRR